jgi:hypothetical protein
MYIANQKLTIAFRAIIVLAAAIGVWNLIAIGNPLELLSFYTIQSNLVVLVFFAWLIWRTWRARPKPPTAPNPTIKGAVTVCIALTFLVYHFVLAPTMFAMADNSFGSSPANLLVHYIVPLMTIADWLLFDPKGRLGKLDPLKWLAIPLAYFAFSLIRAQFATFAYNGSHYPYFFIDFDQYGIAQVSFNILLFAIGYIILGYAVYLVDWALSRLKRPKRRLAKS